MRVRIILSILFFSTSLNLNAQSSNWILHGSGLYSGSGVSVRATKDSLNFYSLGTFISSIKYGDTILNGFSNLNSILSKHDENGKMAWVRRLSGEATSMWTDILDNVYVVGYSGDYVYESENNQVYNTQHVPNNWDSYLIKYSKEGKVEWVSFYSTHLNDQAVSVTGDKNGNIYVAGFSSGNGGAYSFVNKYGKTGRMMWSKKINSVVNNLNTIALLNDEDPIVAGSFSGTLTFAGKSITSDTSAIANGYSIYASVFSAEGDEKDLFQITAGSGNEKPAAVCGTESGFLILGKFSSNATKIGNYLLSNVKGHVFLASFHLDGSVQWVIQPEYSSEGTSGPKSLTLLNDSALLFGFLYSKNIKFPGTVQLESVNQKSFAIAEVNLRKGNIFRMINSDPRSKYVSLGSQSIAVLKNKIAINGVFDGDLFLFGNHLESPANSQDLFVTTFSSNLTSLSEVDVLGSSKVNLFPNPTQQILTVSVGHPWDSASIYYTLYDSSFSELSTGCLHGEDKTIDVSNLVSGTYYIRLGFPQKMQLVPFVIAK